MARGVAVFARRLVRLSTAILPVASMNCARPGEILLKPNSNPALMAGASQFMQLFSTGADTRSWGPLRHARERRRKHQNGVHPARLRAADPSAMQPSGGSSAAVRQPSASSRRKESRLVKGRPAWMIQGPPKRRVKLVKYGPSPPARVRAVPETVAGESVAP